MLDFFLPTNIHHYPKTKRIVNSACWELLLFTINAHKIEEKSLVEFTEGSPSENLLHQIR